MRSCRLKSHHLFESHFCLVRRPNEKGHVETLIGYARRNFLVPVPAVHGGLEPLNAGLEARCRDDLPRQVRGNPTTKAERLDEERSPLLPLPAEAFVAARVEQPLADSLSLVRFDTNDYSVPTAYAHHRVTAVGTVDTVRFVVGDLVVATHRRCWGREQVFYEPIHYLALLERKPGALDFAAPLAGWELPVCFGVLRRRLEAEFGGPGTRQYIKVLRLLEGPTPNELTRAVERALELGTADADAVRLILEHRREKPVGLFCLDGRPHLKLVSVPAPDLSRLQQPDGGGGAVKKLETKSTVLLKHHLKALKLPTMTAECQKVALRSRQGERRPPRVPAPVVRTGVARPRASRGGATAEGGEVPDAQGAGCVRLRGGPVGEQADDPRTDEM